MDKHTIEMLRLKADRFDNEAKILNDAGRKLREAADGLAEMGNSLVSFVATKKSIKERIFEILFFCGNGMSRKRIQNALEVSGCTVDTQTVSIYLSRLKKEGRIEKNDDGFWTVKEKVSQETTDERKTV